jgi:hypothetical protein
MDVPPIFRTTTFSPTQKGDPKRIALFYCSQAIWYTHVMTTLNEIEQAVQSLPPEQLAAFRDWFARYEAQRWDEDFESDVKAGRLDSLAEQAIKDLQNGNCSEL